MMRTVVLGAIVTIGALASAGITAQQAAPAQGRGNAAITFPPLGTIEKVSGNVYLLTGEGGNTAIYVAANGVVLVDTKVENNG